MASLPLKMARRAADQRRLLKEAFPWISAPFIVAAPMRVFTGPELAVAVARAGGLGFIGPGLKPESTLSDLEEAKRALSQEPLHTASKNNTLPVGVGYQVWNGNLDVATSTVHVHQPCAIWLFAPRDGQTDLNKWTLRLRESSPGSQIWVQVGSLVEAMAAASSAVAPPDVIVLQGAEAGGHGRATDGVGIISLLPEVADALDAGDRRSIPLVAAGGIADGRGAAAVLALGAAGVALGTRFLASTESRINKAYQDEVVRAADGAVNTGRTQLYNYLRGTFGWPEQYSPRGLLNETWVDYQSGVSFEELKVRHDNAVKTGGTAAWGPKGRTATYASASVGLVRSVKGAAEIVNETRDEANGIIRSLL